MLVVAGAALVAIGLAAMALDRLGLKLFRLPGDIVWRPGPNTTIYVPVATSILLSVLATLALGWWRRR
jgi:hypothetical protein